MLDNVAALDSWISSRQPSFNRLESTIEADRHKVLCLTPPGQGFHHEDGLRITVSTPQLLEGSLKCKSLFCDATHKISLNGIPLLVFGIITEQGRFIPTFFSFICKEDAESYGKPLREVNHYLLNTYGENLSPIEIVHDNDDSIFLVTKAPFGPLHWQQLVAQNSLAHVNCFVHMLANYSDSRGRGKFDVDKRASQSMLVGELKEELRARGVRVPQGVKKVWLQQQYELVLANETPPAYIFTPL